MNKNFMDYIENNLETIQSKKLFYFKNENLISESLYRTLMYNNVISIKARNDFEAKILDLILNILIDNKPEIYNLYSELTTENELKENEFNLFLNTNLHDVVLLLKQETEAAFKYYMMTVNDVKGENLKDILSKLSIEQKCDARNWLYKFIKNEDLKKFNEFYPFEKEKVYYNVYLENNTSREKYIHDKMFSIYTNSENYYDTYEKEIIYVFNFINNHINLTKMNKKLKPITKEIKFKNLNKYLHIITPSCISFDRQDILKLLNKKLNSDMEIRLEEIFSIKD